MCVYCLNWSFFSVRMIIYQLVLQALTFASLFLSRTFSSKKLGSKCYIYKSHCPMEIWYPEQWKITNHNVWVMVYDIWRFTSFKTDNMVWHCQLHWATYFLVLYFPEYSQTSHQLQHYQWAQYWKNNAIPIKDKPFLKKSATFI